EHFHGGHGADAVQRGIYHLDFISLGWRYQALLPTEIVVRLMGSVVEKVDPTGANRLRPRQSLDGRDLIDQVGHDLVVGRDRLTSALVIKLAAVVVGRIVRRRN